MDLLSRMSRWLLISAISLLLVSCGMFTSILPEHRMVIMIQTARILNPGDSGVSAPLSVYFFQLTEDEKFNSADFFALYDHPKQTLGDSLIAIAKVDLTPNTNARLTLNLKDTTKFVGIVAAYRNLDGVTWRWVVPVTSSWGREKIRLAFKQTGIGPYNAFQTGSEISVNLPEQPQFEGPKDMSNTNMKYEILSYGQ